MQGPASDLDIANGDGANRDDLAAPIDASRTFSVVGLAARGVAIGIAEAIPGVSGGTVALILGVYARLIDAIKAYRPSTVLAFLNTLPKAVSPQGRPAFIVSAKALHLEFLIPIALGMLPALFIGVRILPQLIEDHRSIMHGLFFGMILVSTWVPWAMISHKGPAHVVGVLAGAIAAFVAVGFIFAIPSSLPVLFVSGAVAVCALILPGVSGSYILKATGQYSVVSEALHTRDVVTLGVFLLGMAIGVTLFVRVISWLLTHHAGATLSVLAGLMLGSLRSVWMFQRESGKTMEIKGKAVPILENYMPDSFGSAEVMALVALVVGGAIVGGLLWADKKFAEPSAE